MNKPNPTSKQPKDQSTSWEPSEAQKKNWARQKGRTGPLSPRWKGEAVGKAGVHCWLNVVYGKPSFCEGCGTEKANVYDWANISGKYLRNRDDFLRLCRSCHRRFDLTPEKRLKAMKNLTWANREKKPCLVCSLPTTSRYQLCIPHYDLARGRNDFNAR